RPLLAPGGILLLGRILRQRPHLQAAMIMRLPVLGIALLLLRSRRLRGNDPLRLFLRARLQVARSLAAALLAVGPSGLFCFLGRCSAGNLFRFGNYRRQRRGSTPLALPFTTPGPMRSRLLSRFRRPRIRRLYAGFGVTHVSDPSRRARPKAAAGASYV